MAFLQTVYKDPRIPLHVRLDAAVKAARFERPMCVAKAAGIERPTSATENVHEFRWTEADDELLQRLEEHIKELEATEKPD